MGRPAGHTAEQDGISGVRRPAALTAGVNNLTAVWPIGPIIRKFRVTSADLPHRRPKNCYNAIMPGSTMIEQSGFGISVAMTPKSTGSLI